MRLFVALSVPDAVRAQVRTALDPVRPLAGDAVRWSDPARWHLTLAFLGEVAEARLDRLVERLGRVGDRHEAPTLAVAGAGRFDGRVLWAGVRETPPDAGRLTPLATSVAAAARHTGIDVEDRRYRPHLTLGRASTSTDLRPLVAALGALRTEDWTADDVLLVRSRVGPVPEHTVVAALPLRPQPAPPRTDRPA